MFYTYILYSLKKDKYYVGGCSDLNDRLRRHNSKNKGYTNQSDDWLDVYSKSFETRQNAFEFERTIKKWKSRIQIERLILGSGSVHPD